MGPTTTTRSPSCPYPSHALSMPGMRRRSRLGQRSTSSLPLAAPGPTITTTTTTSKRNQHIWRFGCRFICFWHPPAAMSHTATTPPHPLTTHHTPETDSTQCLVGCCPHTILQRQIRHSAYFWVSLFLVFYLFYGK